MKQLIENLRNDFKQELANIQGIKSAEDLKLKYLSKKGIISDLMSQLRNASAEDKPLLGKLINDVKIEIEDQINKALEAIQSTLQARQLEEERIDISIPGRRKFSGKEHPISLVMGKIIDIFKEMGFSVQYGPDVDSDYYNFEGLNFAKDHPARDMQDTYYINHEYLLRTHTSNTQLHVMEKNAPPIRIVTPGTVYRNEDISARSHVFFHQLEGMYIDKNVSLADLIATFKEFIKKLFGPHIQARFRPSYFPFVEPGIEIDISCTSCGAKGCRLCKQTGWLEIAGAGMVHPEVLKNGGIDPEVYSGYAWGLGIERLTMLVYSVKDIRQFFDNDLRFLSQF